MVDWNGGMEWWNGMVQASSSEIYLVLSACPINLWSSTVTINWLGAY